MALEDGNLSVSGTSDRDKFITDEPLVKVSLDYADVVKGTHLETTLAVSHRWMQPDDPDPDGEQLNALKDFLTSPGPAKRTRSPSRGC